MNFIKQEFWTLKEFASMIGYKPETLRREKYRNQWVYLKFNSRLLFPKHENTLLLSDRLNYPKDFLGS